MTRTPPDRSAAPLRTLPLVAAAALAADLARGQGLPATFVSDADGETIWACVDRDANGDFNGTGEVAVFYDDAVGPVALTTNAGLWRDPDGTLFVTDTAEDVVLRLVDLDGNGDAHGPSEASLWLDGRAGGNASGVLLTSARGMWRDPDGVLWLASSNVVSGGNDAIVRTEDLTGDGDANDAGEAREYYVVSPGGGAGDSIPAAIVRGRDGALYYADNGTAANPPKGLYRLEDLDGSGVIDQPNEVTTCFLAPAQGATAFHWEVSVDAHGNLYLGDNGNELIWKLDDVNLNGVIDPGEESLYWDLAVSSNVWDIDVADDGSLLLVEDQTPDRLLRLVDVDGNGTIDPASETFVLYDDTLAPVDIGSPRALAVVKAGGPGVVYCDPAVVNSTGAPASISATGSADLAANDLVLHVDDMPLNAFGYFLTSRTQGLIANPAGSQGILCLGGSIGRYVGPGQIQNSGAAGAIQLALDNQAMPTPTGLVAALPSETWHFTAWYRDALGGVATSNFADAISVTFR